MKKRTSAALLSAIALLGVPVVVGAVTKVELCLPADQTWTPPPDLTSIKRLVIIGAGGAGGADQNGKLSTSVEI